MTRAVALGMTSLVLVAVVCLLGVVCLSSNKGPNTRPNSSINAVPHGPKIEASVQLKEPNYDGKPLDVWLDKLRQPNRDDRLAAAEVLSRLATPETEAAVPVLRDLFVHEKDEHIRFNVCTALTKIGRAAVPIFIDGLKGGDLTTRREAVWYLRNMGVNSEAALPLLIVALKDQDVAIRLNAVGALGQIGPAAKEAVPALIDALMDDRRAGEDDRFRSSVAYAMGEIGSEAEAPVPALSDALADKNTQVRLQAAWALGQIGPAAKGAAPALQNTLKDSDRDVRETAAKSLKHIQPD
jgi:HEAT repeat protein